MSGPVLQVLGLAGIPVAASAGGAVACAYRSPSDRLRSGIQHFAAGLVFAAASTEIIPDLVQEHSEVGVVVGFALGLVVFLTLGRMEATAESKGKSSATALLLVVAVDVLLDGVLIGIGFNEEAKAGVLLTIALTLELAFLGLTVAGALAEQGAGRRKTIGITVAVALLIVVGGLIGVTVLSHLSGTGLAVTLAFGTVALLYLVTEELLAEAHEVPDTPVLTAMFFLGFLALLTITIAT